MESVNRLVLLAHEDGCAVRIPSERDHCARETHVEISSVATGQIPDTRPLALAELRREQKQRIGWGPPNGIECPTRVLELADGLACARVEDAQGSVDDVTVLGMAHAEKCPVGRESAGAFGPIAANACRLLVPVQEPGGSAAIGHVQAIVVVRGLPDRD
ncbi:MAG: hypothetical protein ABWY83_09055 [Actinomycetota bacterium]